MGTDQADQFRNASAADYRRYQRPAHRFPNRFRVQYMRVPKEKLKATITLEDMYGHSRSNPEKYEAEPATQPTTSPTTGPTSRSALGPELPATRPTTLASTRPTTQELA